jgi:hypothetical protein
MSEFPGLSGLFAGAEEARWKYREVWFPASQEYGQDKPFRFIIDNREIQIPWDQAAAIVREYERHKNG